MIDRYLLPLVKAATLPAARRLAARGIGADQVTLTGFVIGALALPALAAGWWGLALALILANRLADGLDGTLARLAGPTDRGAFLDIALDFCFYSLVPLGFALADPDPQRAGRRGAAGGLHGHLVLVPRLRGDRRTLRHRPRQPAGQGHPLSRRPDRRRRDHRAARPRVACCPRWFPALALAFSAACAVTTVSRWLMGWRAFSAMPGKRRPPD